MSPASPSRLAVLETRVPPPVVAVLVALAMLATRWFDDALPVDRTWRIGIAAGLVVAGFAFSVPAVFSFRAARTTIGPHRIENASRLVTGGVFGLSRNPMYLGLALQLLGWAAFLATPSALVGPVLFVAWITRFQIVPEERLLSARFGTAYDAWRRRVRRWI